MVRVGNLLLVLRLIMLLRIDYYGRLSTFMAKAYKQGGYYLRWGYTECFVFECILTLHLDMK